MMFNFSKITCFSVVGTKAKGNSNNVLDYGTALLKISGHNSIEMSTFVVC